MNNNYLFLLLLPTFYLFNYFLLKNKILLDQIKSSKHKNFSISENVPLSGGILVFISLIFFTKELDNIDRLLLSAIFLLGLLSDLQKMKSPFFRLLLQSFIIFLILFFNKNLISGTRLGYLDYLIENFFIFKFFFTLFCLLVLMNGSNFIDGVNGLSAGYFIVIIVNILISANNFNIPIYSYDLILLLKILTIFLIFNLFSRSFLGDSGSYLLSIYLGLYLISYFNDFKFVISPYYVCLLLWYPAFENLFSILRRKIVKKGFSTFADNEHLHHFLFNFLNKQIKKKKLSNSLSGLIINFLNFMFIFLGSHFINNTKVLVLIIIFLIFVYLISYFLLKKFNNLNC